MAYYYLAASLPALSLNQPASIEAQAFVELCRDHLSGRDQRALEALYDGTGSTHPVVEAWRRRETQLRNAVARTRAQRHQVDAGAALRGHSGYEVVIETAVERAFQAGDPLQRERLLDELRWRLLDEIQGTDGFGAPMILTYLLRMQLCARWNQLTEEQGAARMRQTLEAKPADRTDAPGQAQ